MAISVDDFSPTLQDSTVVELPCGKPTLFFDQAQDSWAMVGLSGRLEDLCRDLRRSVESPGRVEAWEKSLCVSKKKVVHPQKIFRIWCSFSSWALFL